MNKKILPFLYGIYAALFVAGGLFNFVYDNLTMPEPTDIPISEFYAENMKQIGEDTFVSVTNDPQFILEYATPYKIRTVKYTLNQGGTGSKALYYKTSKDINFSEKKCILPPFGAVGNVKYILPRTDITQIRLDISGTLAEIIQLENVQINYKPGFWEYFDIRPEDIFKFIVIPLIIGGIVMYISDIFTFYKKRLQALNTEKV